MKLGRAVPPCALALALLGGCGPPSGGGADAGVPQPCTGTGSRCAGATYQVCTDDVWVTVEACSLAETCVLDLGCVSCDPAQTTLCRGDDVVACDADGTLGVTLETCPAGWCVNGDCTPPGCAAGAELIYVVDSSYRLLSFDPQDLDPPFRLIGQLSCPAGEPWPAWGSTVATPFSMSVDRGARAWILYSSGEIFWVDTTDASCSASPWPRGQASFELFGMGFVSDEPGGQTEQLFIAGGPAATAGGAGNIGRVDPTTLAATSIGPYDTDEYGPELTGTGNAELYGYFPGISSTFVARIDKATGQNLETWPLPPLGSDVQAWAFAHWGGRFYIFVTTIADGPRVLMLDPETGEQTVVVANAGYEIVGAGVSTCAPVIVE